jgi:hypothetical protein
LEFGPVTALFLIGGAAVLLIRRQSITARFTVATCAIALALCIPWLAYTYSQTDRFFYWSNSAGAQIYWMASPRSEDLGDWQGESEVFADRNLAGHQPFFRSFLGRTPDDKDAALRRAALRQIRHDPAGYARNVGANISRQIINFPYSFTEFSPGSALFYGVPNLLVLLLFVSSVVMLVRRRVPARPEILTFILLAVVIFGVHSLVAAYARMFVVTVPLMGAVALYTLASRARLTAL